MHKRIILCIEKSSLDTAKSGTDHAYKDWHEPITKDTPKKIHQHTIAARSARRTHVLGAGSSGRAAYAPDARGRRIT